mmetsp:Transcript_36446/g.60374  ORF Transcript_36446/g.60374 Transcript_36446/m.60374 type:complete len:476 (-) Transcript_36446:347-1774(-)
MAQKAGLVEHQIHRMHAVKQSFSTHQRSLPTSRWKISEGCRDVLEQEFVQNRFPSPNHRKRLADELDVDPRRVQVWFQNRRQREKAGPDAEARETVQTTAPASSELQSSLERYPTPTFGSMGGFLAPPLGNSSAATVGIDAAGESLLGDSMVSYTSTFAEPAVSGSAATRAHSVKEELKLFDEPLPHNVLSTSDDIIHALMGFESEERAKAALCWDGSSTATDELLSTPTYESQPFGGTSGETSELPILDGSCLLNQGGYNLPQPQQTAGCTAAIATGCTSTTGETSCITQQTACAAAAAGLTGVRSSHCASCPLAASTMFSAVASGKLTPQLHAFLSAPASGSSLGATPARGDSTGFDAQINYTRMLQPNIDASAGPASQMVSPRLAPTQSQSQSQQSDLESWLYAADAVNNVLQCARQQYSLAVGRFAAAAAGAGTSEAAGLESLTASPSKPFFASGMPVTRPRDMHCPRDGG